MKILISKETFIFWVVSIKVTALLKGSHLQSLLVAESFSLLLTLTKVKKANVSNIKGREGLYWPGLLPAPLRAFR